MHIIIYDLVNEYYVYFNIGGKNKQEVFIDRTKLTAKWLKTKTKNLKRLSCFAKNLTVNKCNN